MPACTANLLELHQETVLAHAYTAMPYRCGVLYVAIHNTCVSLCMHMSFVLQVIKMASCHILALCQMLQLSTQPLRLHTISRWTESVHLDIVQKLLARACINVYMYYSQHRSSSTVSFTLAPHFKPKKASMAASPLQASLEDLGASHLCLPCWNSARELSAPNIAAKQCHTSSTMYTHVSVYTLIITDIIIYIQSSIFNIQYSILFKCTVCHAH